MKAKFYKGLCNAPSGAKMYRMDGFYGGPPRLFPAPAGYPREQLNPWNPEVGFEDSVGSVEGQAISIVEDRLREQLGPDAVFEVAYDRDPRRSYAAMMKVYVADKTHMTMLKLAAEVLYPEGAAA